jgi:hypothetical protein
MTDRIIPIVRASLPPARDLAAPPQGELFDLRRRRVRDLRISVTDRCNFRCVYCMPKEVFGDDHAFLSRQQLLSFEEDRARRPRLRRSRRREDPHHRRRAPLAPPYREPDRATGKAAGRNHPDHQRLPAGEEGAHAEGCRACTASPSASTV